MPRSKRRWCGTGMSEGTKALLARAHSAPSGADRRELQGDEVRRGDVPRCCCLVGV